MGRGSHSESRRRGRDGVAVSPCASCRVRRGPDGGPMTEPTLPPALQAALDRSCETCGALLARKRYANGNVEEMWRFAARKYCSLTCCGLAQRRPVDDDTSPQPERD